MSPYLTDQLVASGAVPNPGATPTGGLCFAFSSCECLLRRRALVQVLVAHIRNQLSTWSSPAAQSPRSIRVQDWLVFVVSFAFFWRYACHDMDAILGDNIAQVGYWRILFNPHLTGSLGSSSMKPGLILSLGPFHDVSNLLTGGTTPIRYALSLCAALTNVFIARVAGDLGGRFASLVAVCYALICVPFAGLVAVGSSVVFFLPLLCWGIWLHAQGRFVASTVLLCLASLVRLEAICVLGLLALFEQVRQPSLKRAALSAFAMLAIVTTFVLVFYRLQGEFSRFNAGGTSLGYIFSDVGSTPVSRFIGATVRAFRAPASFAFRTCLGPSLGFSALIAFWLYPKHRSYLALLGIFPFLIAFATTGQGPIESRYFQFVLPFLVAFGAGGIFVLPDFFRSKAAAYPTAARWALVACLLLTGAVIAKFGPPPMFWGFTLTAVLALAGIWLPVTEARLCSSLVGAAVCVSSFASQGPVVPELARDLQSAPFTIGAIDLLQTRPVPAGASALVDDDMIYGIVLRDPDYLGKIQAMQYLNVQPDTRRSQILRSADYIVLSKQPYSWDYLTYDPEARGESDPLRHAIRQALNGIPAVAYGRSIRLIRTTDALLILKLDS